MIEPQEPLYMTGSEEKLWQAMLVLTQELSVARDRIDLLERLLADKSLIDAGEIEAFAMDAPAETERSAARSRLVQRLLKPLYG